MPTDLSARSKPDACPGALRVHRAADGGLVRIRIPGGTVTAAQLEELSTAAVELGEGSLQLTSRANLQVRGLQPGAEVPLADRLAAVGLLPSATHERVRNVVASPLSGCDEAGNLDVHPLVAELDRGLCADPRLADLPGRFLFTVDDGRCDVAGLGGDVGLLATGPDQLALLLAGADTGVRVPRESAVRAVLACAVAFLDERDRQGSGAWRLAELPGGVPAVLKRLEEADIEGAQVHRAKSGGPAGAEVGKRIVIGAVGAGPIGSVGATTGPGTLVVGAPLGRLSRTQSETIAALARGGAGWIRVTPWRSVVIPVAPSGNGTSRRDATSHASGAAGRSAAGEQLDVLARLGLVTDPFSPLLGVTACTGRPGCASALADVQADARRVVSDHTAAVPSGEPEARSSEVRKMPIHWVGCGHRCGRPVGRAVEVLATDGGYEVSVGDGPAEVLRTAGEAGAAAEAARRA